MNIIDDTAILAIASTIVAEQKKLGLTPTWGNSQHIGLLRRVVEQLMTGKADAATICKTLDQHGLGGNASQFRQWLNTQDGPTKGAFPARAEALKAYA